MSQGNTTIANGSELMVRPKLLLMCERFEVRKFRFWFVIFVLVSELNCVLSALRRLR